MDQIDYLVIGAGVSGLSFANWIAPREALVVEAEDEPGGYCRTVVRDGFVWDYSGHFFHFKHPEIEAWLRARMPGQDVRTVRRVAKIRYRGRDIDFPFQKNIHQLAKEELIDCLVDLVLRDEAAAAAPPGSFLEMLYRRYGKGIADRFLVPYNEKLYATDLGALDRDAMGRFFPHADLVDIVRNMRTPDNGGYNATFTYPAGGAIEYVRAMLRDLPPGSVSCGERVVRVDLAARTAETTRRTLRWGRIVSSAPLPALCAMTGIEHDPGAFGWSTVQVFNLGFDRKGPTEIHWMYFPDRARSFYRVGWYDNIIGSPARPDLDRMSLYVEIGVPAGVRLDLEAARARVLDDLAAEGIVDGHRLVAWHAVTLDPAYVHITGRSIAEHRRVAALLDAAGVHTVGRYGGWTYCSIEDNMVETRALARRLTAP